MPADPGSIDVTVTWEQVIVDVQRALTTLKLDDTLPTRARLHLHHGSHSATPLWMIVLDYGFAETVVAADLYGHHAAGIVSALAAVLNVPVETPDGWPPEKSSGQPPDEEGPAYLEEPRHSP